MAARNTPKNTQLHRAAIEGNATVISDLIQHGASVNERGERGRTALHQACVNGHVACIHELMTHGADVEARDNNKATPLQQLRFTHQEQITFAGCGSTFANRPHHQALASPGVAGRKDVGDIGLVAFHVGTNVASFCHGDSQ